MALETRDDAIAEITATLGWRFDTTGALAKRFIDAAQLYLLLTPENSLTSQRADTRFQTQFNLTLLKQQLDEAVALVRGIESRTAATVQQIKRLFHLQQLSALLLPAFWSERWSVCAVRRQHCGRSVAGCGSRQLRMPCTSSISASACSKLHLHKGDAAASQRPAAHRLQSWRLHRAMTAAAPSSSKSSVHHQLGMAWLLPYQ